MQHELWINFLSCLERKVNQDSIDIWFKPMRCESMTDSAWVVSVPNQEHCNWLESQYSVVLSEAVQEATGRAINVSLVVDGERSQQARLPWSEGNLETSSQTVNVRETQAAFVSQGRHVVERQVDGICASRLNPDYTFESFVVGQSNEFSYAAARGVVAQPATDYNPLFLYGGVGLGKTHLMHAIGNELSRTMGLRVLYLTSEEFLNDMLKGIQSNKMAEFRERFRVQCDVLLIDDIQFISDKQHTQEEFFHTFNSLQANKKQIVISADKSPQEIKGLEDRLISRFSGGLPVEIKAPELEMRIAILREKASHEKIEISEEVAHYIASKVTTNVRELEGSLKRVIARARLSKERINLRVASQVIEPYIKQRAAILTPEAIIQKVSAYYGVTYAEIMGKSRTKPIVFPRQMAMYLSRQYTSMSLPELGRVFGRDHTTVINAIERVKLAQAMDPSVAVDILTFERTLSATKY